MPVSGWGVPVDDLVSTLNPVQERDLAYILDCTPERRRVAVALAWVEWSIPQWAEAAGIEHVTLHRWLTKQNRVPLGGAVRLARVLGVDPLQLFAGWL